ncbi:outer membrane protein [Aliamphritea hakodatensis]|uniref:outer membrane protein n=1 Tax=Aliamphritea hakodatensis TaxID=2895352 RepID=UPI0022FD4BA1|nr:outer membrane beta-barrel protein [Aliamphritea hakodatensis]
MQNTFIKRSFVASMILAASAVAPIAQAGSGWYGEISILSTDVDDTSLNSSGRNVTAEFDKDTAFSIAGGYSYEANSLGNVRIEAEYLTTDNDTDSVNFNGNNFPANGQAVGGSLETRALFLNVTQEFNTPSETFTPYLGIGVGYADVDSSISYGPVANIDDNDSAFAYQIQAGLDVKFTEQLTGFAEYRYVAIDDIDLDRFGGGPGGIQTTRQSGDLDFDAFSLGLRYNF